MCALLQHIKKTVIVILLAISLLPVYPWVDAFLAENGRSAYAQSLPQETTPKVVLQGLDKVTARVFTLEYHIGEVIRFGTLEIVVRKCWQSSPEDLPEQAAFLDIVETRPGERTEWIFRGWMFASSPAISSLEHAVYDVWLLDCINSDQMS